MPYPGFHSSPLLLHRPQSLANDNNSPAFQMPSTPSRSSSPAFASAHSSTGPGASSGPSSHQIPFNATPVHHAPSPLGFGFGFGSSFGDNNNNNAGISSSSSSSHLNSSFAAASALANSFASPSLSSMIHSPRRGDAKRRRDLDEDGANEDDEDMNQASAQHSLSPRMRGSPGTSELSLAAVGGKRVLASASKRMRAASLFPASPQAAGTGFARPTWGTSTTTDTSAIARPTTNPGKGRMSGLDVDLGKMLASVDKASLLSMLMNLLAQSKDPNLSAQILSLLPTPSLESVETALDEAEKNVRAAIPFVVAGGAAGVRDEYTWSRVRTPLAAFSDAALSYLPFFVSELDSSKRDGANAAAKREEVHPATTFTFLHALTLRVLRLHTLLPAIPKSGLSFSALRPDSALTSFGFGFGAGSGSGSSAASGSIAAVSSVQASPAANAQQQARSTKHSNLAERIPDIYTSPVSPDALLSTLMPALLKQWTVLVERLDLAVNVEGRMFGQEVVLGWARALDTVNSQGASDRNPSSLKAEETIIREAMDEVRNRLERDLGWLVGGGHGPAVQRAFTPAASRPAVNHEAADSNQLHRHASQPQQRQQPSTAPTAAGGSTKRTRGSSMDDDEEEL